MANIRIMVCSLCLEANDNLIDFADDEARNISTILFKHLPFCFIEKPMYGYVCGKCWSKVDTFHQFYVHIEEIQSLCYKGEYAGLNKCDVGSEDLKDLLNNTIVHAHEYENVAELVASATEDNGENILDQNGFRESEGNQIQDAVINDHDNSNHAINAGDINNDDGIEDDGDHNDPNTMDADDFNNDDETQDDDDDFDDDYKDETLKNRVKAVDDTTNQQKKSTKKKYNQNQIKCKHCENTYPTVFKIRCHMKLNHTELRFVCNHGNCLEAFKTAEDLKKHKEIHGKMPCPTCGRVLKVMNMAKHIQNMHVEIKKKDTRVVCDLCGRVSNNIVAHRYHYRGAHEVHGRLQCDICKEWYKNIENIRAHMRTIHVQAKLYGPQTCTICGKVSLNMKALAKHKQIHLEGSNERFKCDVCGRGFRFRTRLKEHSYIHTGSAGAYVCQYCGKTFRFSSSISVHRKKCKLDFEAKNN